MPKHVDEIYKDWCGVQHTVNSCHPVHDSAECTDFAEYYHKESTEQEIKELQQECNHLHKQRASRNFYFDCYDRKGKLSTKLVVAENKADAKILFSAKFTALSFDEPYNL